MILKQRGCYISDEQFAKEVLRQINYYRLTAYFLSFKTANGNYIDGTSFHTIYRIYEFDRKLRSLLYSLIEEIELMLRTQLSYYYAHRYGPLGYMSEGNFNNKHNHKKFIEHYEQSIKNNKNQPFVKHHLNNYEGCFPIWVLIELFSMGELSHFFSDLLRHDKKTISADLFHSTDTNVSSWLRCLTDLRNCCAHYSRLYNYKFTAIPATPLGCTYKLNNKIFDYVIVLKLLYYDIMRWKNEFLPNLEALMEEYKGSIILMDIGFPENWIETLSESNPVFKK